MASKALGVLTVDLVLRLGGFTQGMDKAGREAALATGKLKALEKEFGRFALQFATPIERARAELRAVNELLNRGLSPTVANRAFKAIGDAAVSAIPAFERWNALVEKYRKQTEALISPMERFRQEFKEITRLALAGEITPIQRTQLIGQARARRDAADPDTVAASGIVQRNITDLERYQAELAEADALLKRGKLSQDEYNKTVARLGPLIAASSPAQQEANRLKAEGARLTLAVLTPQEQLTRKIAEYNTLLKAGTISQTTFNRAVAQARSTYARATRGFLALNTTVGGIGRQLQTLTGGYLGVIGIREIFRLINSYQLLTNKLRLVTSSTAELARVQEEVFRIAQLSSQPLESVADLYARIGRNSKRLGLDLQQTINLTELVSKAMAVSGASAQEAAASLIQFGQSLSGSRGLSGDELKSLSENFPILLEAIARGTNKAYGELRTLGSQGKLTGEVIAQAIASQADFIEEKFLTRVRTISQAFTEVRNSIQRVAGSTDAQPLVDSIVSIARTIEDPEFQQSFALFVEGLVKIATLSFSTLGNLVRLMKEGGEVAAKLIHNIDLSNPLSLAIRSPQIIRQMRENFKKFDVADPVGILKNQLLDLNKARAKLVAENESVLNRTLVDALTVSTEERAEKLRGIDAQIETVTRELAQSSLQRANALSLDGGSGITPGPTADIDGGGGEDTAKKIESARDQLESFIEKLQEQRASLGQTGLASERFSVLQGDIAEALRISGRAAGVTREQLLKLIDALEQDTAFQSLVDQTKELQNQAVELEAARIEAEKGSRAAFEYRLQFGELAETVNKAKGQVTDLGRLTENLPKPELDIDLKAPEVKVKVTADVAPAQKTIDEFVVGFRLKQDTVLPITIKTDITEAIEKLRAFRAQLLRNIREDDSPGVREPSANQQRLLQDVEAQLAVYEKQAVALKQVKTEAADTQAYAAQSIALGQVADRTAEVNAELEKQGRLYDDIDRRNAITAIEEQVRSLEEEIRSFEAERIALEQGAVAALQYRIAHGDLKKVFDDAGAGAAAFQARLEQLTRVQEQQAAVSAARELVPSRTQAAREYFKVLEGLRTLLNEGEIEQRDFNAAVRQAERNFRDATRAAGELTDVFRDEAMRAAERSIADFLVKPFEDGLVGLVDGFTQALREIAANIVAAQLSKKLFEGFEDGFGDLTSNKGFIEKIKEFFGSIFGGNDRPLEGLLEPLIVPAARLPESTNLSIPELTSAVEGTASAATISALTAASTGLTASASALTAAAAPITTAATTLTTAAGSLSTAAAPVTTAGTTISTAAGALSATASPLTAVATALTQAAAAISAAAVQLLAAAKAVPSVSSPAGSALSLLGNFVGPREKGGPVPRGRTALVGERAPEIAYRGSNPIERLRRLIDEDQLTEIFRSTNIVGLHGPEMFSAGDNAAQIVPLHRFSEQVQAVLRTARDRYDRSQTHTRLDHSISDQINRLSDSYQSASHYGRSGHETSIANHINRLSDSYDSTSQTASSYVNEHLSTALRFAFDELFSSSQVSRGVFTEDVKSGTYARRLALDSSVSSLRERIDRINKDSEYSRLERSAIENTLADVGRYKTHSEHFLSDRRVTQHDERSSALEDYLSRTKTTHDRSRSLLDQSKSTKHFSELREETRSLLETHLAKTGSTNVSDTLYSLFERYGQAHELQSVISHVNRLNDARTQSLELTTESKVSDESLRMAVEKLFKSRYVLTDINERLHRSIPGFATGGFLSALFGGGGLSSLADSAKGGFSQIMRLFGFGDAAGGFNFGNLTQLLPLLSLLLPALLKRAGGGPLDVQAGGMLRGPGTPTSDSMLLWGSTKEFMVQARAAQQAGAPAFLNAFNRGEITMEQITAGFRALNRPDLTNNYHTLNNYPALETIERFRDFKLPTFATGGSLGMSPQMSYSVPGAGMTPSPEWQSTTIVQHLTINSPDGNVSRPTQLQVTAAAARGARVADRRNN